MVGPAVVLLALEETMVMVALAAPMVALELVLKYPARGRARRFSPLL